MRFFGFIILVRFIIFPSSIKSEVGQLVIESDNDTTSVFDDITAILNGTSNDDYLIEPSIISTEENSTRNHIETTSQAEYSSIESQTGNDQTSVHTDMPNDISSHYSNPQSMTPSTESTQTISPFTAISNVINAISTMIPKSSSKLPNLSNDDGDKRRPVYNWTKITIYVLIGFGVFFTVIFVCILFNMYARTKEITFEPKSIDVPKIHPLNMDDEKLQSTQAINYKLMAKGLEDTQKIGTISEGKPYSYTVPSINPNRLYSLSNINENIPIVT